jgi:hypothetical protein
MRAFRFDPKAYAEQYATDGYVHVVKGVNPEFVEFTLAQARNLIGADADLREWKFNGKKAQFLFDFPSREDWSGVKDAVAALTGLSRRALTLCERHIKVYDANAPEAPPPHKDRLASEVAVGFPLVVAQGSHLVLYPKQNLDVNRFGSTELYRRSLDEDALPEKGLAGVEPVRVDMQPGDVVMFRGSAIYHERIKAANSIVLYFKFNALRLDPLGEDPGTPAQRDASLKWLGTASHEELLQLAIEVSPRLDRVTRLYSRLEWSPILQAQVWGEKEFVISEQDLWLIKAADGATPVGGLLRAIGYEQHEFARVLPALRRLVRLQALDLVPVAARSPSDERLHPGVVELVEPI